MRRGGTHHARANQRELEAEEGDDEGGDAEESHDTLIIPCRQEKFQRR